MREAIQTNLTKSNKDSRCRCPTHVGIGIVHKIPTSTSACLTSHDDCQLQRCMGQQITDLLKGALNVELAAQCLHKIDCHSSQRSACTFTRNFMALQFAVTATTSFGVKLWHYFSIQDPFAPLIISSNTIHPRVELRYDHTTPAWKVPLYLARE